MGKLQLIVQEKINVERMKHSDNPPKNDCEKCARLPEWKFCSRECYYASCFDYKWWFYSTYMEEAPKYFNIQESQKEEFKEFMAELMELYY